MKILIVDDEFTSRRILQKSLQPFGSCDVACNGVEAWSAFEDAHREGSPYQLILLDIVMPEMDGKEVLRKIREYEKRSKANLSSMAQIAMATTLADKDSVLSAFRDQCDGYITKPYSQASLLEDLRKFGMLKAA